MSKTNRGEDGRVTWLLRAGGAATVALIALGAAGCTVRTSGELDAEYPTVRAEVAPVRIEAYPRYTYRGTAVYLVDDQWYYRSRGGWVIFSDEPRELQRHRVERYRRNGRNAPAYSTPRRRVYR